MPLIKVRNKLGKTVLECALRKIVKEILCHCNFMVSRVYDISTDLTNQFSLLNNQELGVNGI